MIGNWLRANVYLASWLALPLTLVIAVIQTVRTPSPAKIPVFRWIIYFAFLTCLAAIMTPAFDTTAREFAHGFLYLLLGFIIVDGVRNYS